MNDQDLARCAYFEDAIARLAVAGVALRSVGESALAVEVDVTRDKVISEYTKFLAGKVEPGAIAALVGRQS